MDAQHLEVLAAVAGSALTSVALWIIDVWLDTTAVAWLDVGHVLSDFQDLNAQFVTQDARIGNEGKRASVTTEIGAADAHAVNAHAGLTLTGSRGRFDVGTGELVGLLKNDGFH